jgi:cytochrome c peroxidase
MPSAQGMLTACSLGLFLVCASFGGCGLREKSTRRDAVDGYAMGDQPIEPLPVAAEFDIPRAALGEALFKEPRLSGDGKVSCADCHHADHGLADDKPRSFVSPRPETPVNSPTMYNVRFLYKLSWAGKYDSLEAHLDGLMKNPKVMASSWESANTRLAEVPSYGAQFAAVFPDGLTPNNVRQALLDYERSLTTPNSAFDRYLRGDTQALSAEAKRGFGLFKSFGCVSCHQGMAIGGNVFERFGVLRDIFADRGHFDNADLGRFNVTGRAQDRFVFRVPSLRNVALTAPYFHDGSAGTLEAAVSTMASYQLGRELDAQDRTALVSFLRSLTGEYRGKPL